MTSARAIISQPRTGASRGGGRLTRPVGTSDFTVKSQAVLHVTHVEVRGRSMTVRAVDVAGTTLDSFELTLPD